MRRKTSLYLVSKDCSDGTVAALAEAAKDQNAYLACLILGSPPGRPYFVSGTSAIGAAAMPADWIDRFKEAKQTAETRAAAVNRLLTDTGCAGDVQYAVCAGADIRLICAQRAKTCDIAQVSADLREHEDVFGEALHGLLFQSPIPVLLNGSPFSKYGRVFLAWDSSLAAAVRRMRRCPISCAHRRSWSDASVRATLISAVVKTQEQMSPPGSAITVAMSPSPSSPAEALTSAATSRSVRGKPVPRWS